MFSGTSEAFSQRCYRLVFWNVENFFDIWDDTTRNDDAFTPSGDNHWTKRRYEAKLTNIAKTLVAIGGSGNSAMPLLVGMAEVENDKVLRDLCQGTPLRRYRYGFVHFNSPDRRGIDNVLLYQKESFTPYYAKAICVSDSSVGFFTRDILLVEGTTNVGDTLIAIVCHFPSKRGGSIADRQRRNTALMLRSVMDSVVSHHPGSAMVVMGDFNAAPQEKEIFDLFCVDTLNYVNLMCGVERGKGTYKYQDHWSCLDQIIVNKGMYGPMAKSKLRVMQKSGQIFDAPFLLVDDDKYLGKKVNRTYLAMKYIGGYSDHLPVYIDICE